MSPIGELIREYEAAPVIAVTNHGPEDATATIISSVALGRRMLNRAGFTRLLSMTGTEERHRAAGKSGARLPYA